MRIIYRCTIIMPKDFLQTVHLPKLSYELHSLPTKSSFDPHLYIGRQALWQCAFMVNPHRPASLSAGYRRG